MQCGCVHVLLLLPHRPFVQILLSSTISHDLIHEGDVGDGQSKGLNSRQALLVRESGDLRREKEEWFHFSNDRVAFCFIILISFITCYH